MSIAVKVDSAASEPWTAIRELGLAESDVPQLSAARIAAQRSISALRAELPSKRGTGGPLPDDAEVVAFGSLARLELTLTSDLDFYIVTASPPVVGQGAVDVALTREMCKIASRDAFGPGFSHELGGPGSSQIFGVYVRPETLYDTIGLDVDSNRQMTRRVLLLAESTSLLDPDRHKELLQRVVHRYLRERRQGSEKPPRFLVNDFARYWRTLSVDFEAKADQGQRYGLRYLKLLVSRKFLYAATLFPLVERTSGDWRDNGAAEAMLVDSYAATPIERASAAAVRLEESTHGRSLSEISALVQCLDRFNGLLGDTTWRERVVRVSQEEEDPREDDAFRAGLEIAHEVDQHLRDLFFTEPLTDFTREFLVF